MNLLMKSPGVAARRAPVNASMSAACAAIDVHPPGVATISWDRVGLHPNGAEGRIDREYLYRFGGALLRDAIPWRHGDNRSRHPTLAAKKRVNPLCEVKARSKLNVGDAALPCDQRLKRLLHISVFKYSAA